MGRAPQCWGRGDVLNQIGEIHSTTFEPNPFPLADTAAGVHLDAWVSKDALTLWSLSARLRGARFMQTIEILGSPGVGKSTVSECLSELWKPGEEWVPESRLLARLDPPAGPNLRTAYRALRRLLGSREGQPLAMWPSLSQRFIEQHQAFADLLMRTLATSVINSERDASWAFGRTIHLARTFAKLHCLSERCTVQLVVLDEGLLKHASHLFLDEGFAPTRKRLLDDEVMPTSYVLLDAPGATIAERSVSRSKRAWHHEGLDRSALEDYCSRSAAMWHRIATGLSEEGKQVLILDAVRPAEENARELRLFAQRLAKGASP